MQAQLKLVHGGADSTQDENTSGVQSIGARFDDLLNRHVAAYAEHAMKMRELAGLEQAILRSEDYMAAVKPLDEDDLRDHRKKLAVGLRQRLVRHAEEIFAPAGRKLSIDEDELTDKFDFDKDDPAAFSLTAIWDYLEQTYGGQAGVDRAWQQAAAELISALHLKHHNEVVRKAGRVIITLSVYLDSIDKKSGKNNLSYGSCESVVKAALTLRGFANWCQNSALATHLGELAEHFSYMRNRGFESRKQLVCGDDQELIVVPYQNKFEFRLSEACATQLQLFLGTYGNLNKE